jgi:hypothetical protein
MSARDAEQHGIDDDDRHRIVRLDDAKANLGLISGRARWFRRVGVRRAARSSIQASCSRSTGAGSARSTSLMPARRTSFRSACRGRQYKAPADFVETANTIGLPRYAKQAVDQQFARWVMLHVQSNPLPICTRPRVLIKGKRT